MAQKLLLMTLLFAGSILHGQDTLRGRIWRADTNAPVPMVNILLKGSSKGTMTDFEGAFMLLVPTLKTTDTLLFSCLGYKPVREPADLFTGYPFTLRMQEDAILLSEVIITPRSAEDYLRMSLNRRKDNYVTEPYSAFYYYREIVRENKKPTQYEEAIIQGHLPRRYTSDSTRLYLYGARQADNLSRVQFMKNYVDKQQNKAIKKAKKAKKIPVDSAAKKQGIRINFSTPYWLLDSNFAWKDLGFLNPKKFKFYEYQIQRITDWLGHKVLVITFDQRAKIHEPLYKGTIYLEEKTLAVVAVDFGLSERGLKYLVPGYVKPLIWAMGISYEPPRLHFHMRFKQVGERWDFHYVYTNGYLHIEKSHWFKDDEISDFNGEQLLYLLERNPEAEFNIPEGKWLERKKPLYQQFDNKYGNQNWERFSIPKHELWK